MKAQSFRAQWVALHVLAAGIVLSGCLDRELKPVNPCLVSGVVDRVQVTNVDKVDLLFMVDNSKSMEAEQALLAEQFRNLVQILASGDLDGDGAEDFPPVQNLNLGVVTSDLGLPGIDRANLDGCDAQGDDARLISQNRTAGQQPNCPTMYPKFLTFNPDRDNPDVVADTFRCLATVGIDGCGFEQQLEAVLKALAPADLVADVKDDSQPEPVRFLDANGQPMAVGHGGTGFNSGFLREDSLLGVIVVTDEEDCSGHTLSHLEYDQPEGNAVWQNCQQAVADGPGINARCSCDWVKQNYLYPIKRYVNGLKALKPGNENLVMFATISGVPLNLVDSDAKAQFNNLETAQDRQAYYQNMLTNPRMQEVLDPNSPDPRVQTSCIPPGGGSAKPPRRIVQVAEGFGENGVVESICNDSFAGALESIIEVISNILNAVCLPRDLDRDIDGLVDCDVIWELPTPAEATDDTTPTECDQLEFLQPPPPDRPQRTREGRARCVVQQIPVLDRNNDGMITSADRPSEDETGRGWFYDDFTDEVKMSCEDTPQRILFTEFAQPDTGVEVRLECLNQVQTVSEVEQGGGDKRLGDSCQPSSTVGCGRSDTGCRPYPTRPNGDAIPLCCHPTFTACVQTCSVDAECPAAWVCDTRPETQTGAGLAEGGEQGICVNPTCG